MRIHGGTPEAFPYSEVWHVPLCKNLHNIAWADDETMEYAQYSDNPLAWLAIDYSPTIYKVKKIEFRPLQGVIYIDPVPDTDFELRELEVSVCE